MSEIVEVLNEIVERHDCSHPAIVSKASAEITRLTAEIEKLKADLAFADAQCAKVEGLFLGTHKENEKLRAALKLAGTGLKAGLFQYAERDFHGNIIPGDEQYPWIKAMQIGLDAVTAALPPLPALSGDKQ
jgi:hypothetical protein